MRMLFSDCAPQMHFLFLFSCSQGLSSFSTSICSHLPLNSSLPPLLQPGQHHTSFQSLYFKKKIKYMKSEWLQNHILVLSLASQSTIVVQTVYRALYQVIGYYLLDCSSGTKNSVLVTTLFHMPPLYERSERHFFQAFHVGMLTSSRGAVLFVVKAKYVWTGCDCCFHIML